MKLIRIFLRRRKKNVSRFRTWNPYLKASYPSPTNAILKLAFIFNTLKKFFNFGKDPLYSSSHNDVVYKISCQNCEATYVGQTKRQLKTRILEHSADIKKESGPPSVISNHRINDDHDFNWTDIKILDHERNYKKRLIFEMVHIIKQKHDLNRQSDTEFLPEAYFSLLNLSSSL